MLKMQSNPFYRVFLVQVQGWRTYGTAEDFQHNIEVLNRTAMKLHKIQEFTLAEYV